MMEHNALLEELERKGFVVVPTTGVSMQPLLYTHRTHVLIRKPDKPLKKHDVVLYTRPDGSLVLHRVIRMEDTAAWIRGDNTFSLERVAVSDIRGVMDRVWRGNREISVRSWGYRAYTAAWCASYPARALHQKAVAKLRSRLHSLLGASTLGWIIRNLKGSLPGIFLLTLLTSVNTILGVGSALVLRQVIDYAAAGQSASFWQWMGFYGGLVAVQLAIRAGLRRLSEKTTIDAEQRLRRNTYANILQAQYAQIRHYHTAQLQSRLGSDAGAVAGGAVAVIPSIAHMAVQMVFALLILTVMDWRLSGVFVLGGCAMLAGSLLLRRRMKLYHKQVQQSGERLYGWLQESMERIPVVKGFQAENRAMDRSEGYMEDLRRIRMKRNAFSNWCNLGLGTMMQGSSLLALGWCGVGMLQGSLSYGTMTAVMQLVGQIRAPFVNVSSFIPQLTAIGASAERLMELEPLVKDRQAPGELPLFETLEARNLCFRYDDGEADVLVDGNFTIARGDVAALTGLSGIGKSTLLKLLLGLYAPKSGRLYGRCGGAEIPIDETTRPWFSYVPQGNHLMSGSIYQAVDFLHPGVHSQAQKERIRQACVLACADEFITRLPQGYDTVLGEQGAGLSEGQLQRIAIARAIYRNAPVLLLDEATSALDAETERRLLENLRNQPGQTVLFVTHRTQVETICTTQLVFRDGRITQRR